MNHAILINHGVAVRRKRPAQRNFWIEFTVLVEVDDTQPLGWANLAGFRFDISTHQAKQRSLAASIGTDQPYSHPRGDTEMNVFEECAAANTVENSLKRDELLVFPVRRGEIDFRAGDAAACVHLCEFADHHASFVN